MNLRQLVLCIAGIGALLAAPAFAEAPQPFPSFEAKRIKPPPKGSTNRIRVQIDPAEQQAALAAPVLPAAAGAPRGEAGDVGQFGWFWSRISPDLGQSGPGRLEAAMLALDGQAGQVPAPRLQHLQDIARAQGVPILTATVGTQVSPALVLAMIAVESAGRPDAVSSAGAVGLMQLMPDTATRFGVGDRTVPAENIAGGVKYLDWLMSRFDRDPILVLAGYNAGEGAVANHSGVPPFAETRDYVPKVLAAFQVAKGLCRTPPELISDGCVFVAMN